MGPLHSLLCWHQGRMGPVWDNPTPAVQKLTYAARPAGISEPRETRNAIRQHKLEQWLWEPYPAAVTQLMAHGNAAELAAAVSCRMPKPGRWGSTEQVHFLSAASVGHPICPTCHSWTAQPGETPTSPYHALL